MKRPLWRHDVVVLILGILSVGIVYWYDSGSITPEQQTAILWIDGALVLYFLADWVMTWREHAWRKRWPLVNSWRLLGMIPLVFAGFSFLRLLRLARVVSVMEKLPPIRAGLHSLKRQLDWRTLTPLAFAAGSITFLGALLVWLAERGTNSALHQFSEAIWWAIVTVTTVGYGDITPITRIGRLVAVVLMVTGIGTIGMLASQVSSALIARSEEEEEAAEEAGLAGQLAQLAALHDAGKLDDAEFVAAKAHLLGGASA